MGKGRVQSYRTGCLSPNNNEQNITIGSHLNCKLSRIMFTQRYTFIYKFCDKKLNWKYIYVWMELIFIDMSRAYTTLSILLSVIPVVLRVVSYFAYKEKVNVYMQKIPTVIYKPVESKWKIICFYGRMFHHLTLAMNLKFEWIRFFLCTFQQSKCIIVVPHSCFRVWTYTLSNRELQIN